MEAVEDMMGRMKLSAAEKKGIRVEVSGPAKAKAADPQAIGKVFAEKLVHADNLAQTLGRIWCPIKGVACKDLGENRFLFTFLQAAGKRRALEDGPWMFGKDLVVMVDLDETKSIEEMEFVFIPIWVRVMKLPFGMMNKVVGEAIGGELGSFVCMDLDEDDTALGSYLRIKVRLDIRKPLMRGVTVYVGEEGKEKPVWCPVEYEFLPDFCYTCGIIGHTDKICGIKLAPGEVQQFSKKLRCLPSKRRGDDGGDRFVEGKQQSHWRMGGGGSGGFSRDSSGRGFSGRGGSDAPSWRRSGSEGGGTSGVRRKEEDEVTSPLKLKDKQVGEGKPRKALFLVKGKEEENKGRGEEARQESQKAPTGALAGDEQEKREDVNSTMHAMHVDEVESVKTVAAREGGDVGKGKGGRKGTYKKVVRTNGKEQAGEVSPALGKKRVLEDEASNVSKEKKLRRVVSNEKAGLSEQPCEDQ
ncbi:unnamed protein product [Urochloa humidicola]